MLSERTIDEISGEIVDAAIHLHRRLGPGLLENVYETILTHDLEARGLKVERQKQVPFDFEGQHFKDGLRLDMLVESQVVVEINRSRRWLRFIRNRFLRTCGS